MEIIVSKNKVELGRSAAAMGIEFINQAISKNGEAHIIMATGASQFELINHLVQGEVDWSKVTCFHLDEYIELPISHPASFRKYLKERFVDKVQPKKFHYIQTENNIEQECQRLNDIISQILIDVAFIGIGENGHLAFNDPPANFKTHMPYIQVFLNDQCRQQQLGEAWFNSLEEVPRSAISMSVQQILKSKKIICSVPDQRKAIAVDHTINRKIDPNYPSTILRSHSCSYLYLDPESSSLLK